ncbi:MAG: hypothetical protein OXF79_18525 [Chloroflexi bacterium]|nr:hypothetical protein [Chloroflexota bacterium]
MTTAEDLKRFWDECDRRARLLEQDLAEVRADMDACERLLSRYRPDSRAASEVALFHAHILPSRMAGCLTQMEAFKAIALDSGGVVRVGEASRLVHAAGLSKGKASSIASSMPKRLNESEEWEYLEPGTYRLLTFNDEADTAEDHTEPDDDHADANMVPVEGESTTIITSPCSPARPWSPDASTVGRPTGTPHTPAVPLDELRVNGRTAP